VKIETLINYSTILSTLDALNLDLAIGEKNIFRHEDCTVLSPLNLIGSWREESRAPTKNRGLEKYEEKIKIRQEQIG